MCGNIKMVLAIWSRGKCSLSLVNILITATTGVHGFFNTKQFITMISMSRGMATLLAGSGMNWWMLIYFVSRR
jgi:hypothetical protein